MKDVYLVDSSGIKGMDSAVVNLCGRNLSGY
jgi:hypothetical protein